MKNSSLDVRFELDGWALFQAHLRLLGGADAELAELRSETAVRVRTERRLDTLAADPTVAALRKLFRSAGCDPTRYRPSSEALLRRVLKGAEIPAIHPLVDVNNCLSALLAVPCCVMAAEAVEPPLVLRAGADGESYASLRGPFNLHKKPLLVDAAGPLDAPITGSQRVKIRPTTERAWLVAYLPAGIVAPETVRATLDDLLERAPVASIEAPTASR